MTEGFNLDDEYGPTLDKAGLQYELDMMGIEYKKADTNPVLRLLLEKGGYKFKKELGKTERDAIESIIHTANSLDLFCHVDTREKEVKFGRIIGIFDPEVKSGYSNAGCKISNLKTGPP